MNDEAGQNMIKDKLNKEDKTPANTYIPQIYPPRLRWSCIALEPGVSVANLTACTRPNLESGSE